MQNFLLILETKNNTPEKELCWCIFHCCMLHIVAHSGIARVVSRNNNDNDNGYNDKNLQYINILISVIPKNASSITFLLSTLLSFFSHLQCTESKKTDR